MDDEKLKAVIIEKIKKGEDLSVADTFFYLTKVMNHTPDEANTIIAIAENKNKNVIID